MKQVAKDVYAVSNVSFTFCKLSIKCMAEDMLALMDVGSLEAPHCGAPDLC